jgi:sialic acid synthase SpsE
MSRPLLIAECCQNHNGNLDVLRRMIHSAAEAGADYVKIQALYSRDVTRRERFEEGVTAPDGSVEVIQRPYAAEVERLAGLDLSPDDEAWFVDECWRAGVAPMITVFTRGEVDRLGELGFEAVKIASYDCASPPLLADVARRWSRVFVSTGATLDDEIATAAAVLTAVVIERHYTVLAPGDTRDGPVSIDPAQLAELRAFADLDRTERVERLGALWPDWAEALGSARRDLSAEELRNRDYYAGRVATSVGDRLVYNWEDV